MRRLLGPLRAAFAPASACALVGSLLALGCAPAALVGEARHGDFGALERGVAARQARGSLGKAEAARIARAVAEWEVTRAPAGEQVERVEDLRACAYEVDGALAARAETHDAAGARAALARVESGRLGAGSARDYVSDPDDGWRAVGARGLVRSGDDAAARARAFVDPAPSVRRSAMHAAAIAKDPSDVGPLAEVARVDPDLIVRTDAARALGAIGGPAAFARLRDLFTSQDEPEREDIAAAFAAPATREAGGREELRLLLASRIRPAAIEGAAAVLRGAPRAGDDRDAELEASATALLARAIAKASRRDRLHAVAVAPLDRAAIVAALRSAAGDDDGAVRVAVLGRLASLPADHDASVRALEALAQQGAAGAPLDGTSPASPERGRPQVASRALLALAYAHDLRAQAWIEADLASPDGATRLGAASALAALGRPARAAPLLADADPSVRTRASCTILLGAR